MQNIKLTRRQMLTGTAALGAALFLPRPFRSAGAAPGRSFKIGACDWSIGRMGQVNSLELAAEIGLDGVQVSFDAPGRMADLRSPEARQRIQAVSLPRRPPMRSGNLFAAHFPG